MSTPRPPRPPRQPLAIPPRAIAKATHAVPVAASRPAAGPRPVPPAGALVRRGKLPAYVQCAALLRHRIEHGSWPRGSRLPSLEQLADELDLAVVTVRQAVALLERDGLLERRQGVGTFVVGEALPRDWLSLGTRWDSLLASIGDLRVEVVHVRRDHAVPRLQPGEGQAAAGYRFLSRLHSRDGQPFCLIQLHLAHDVYQLDPRRFDRELVLPLLTRRAPERIVRAWQVVRVAKADPDSAGQLGIDAGDPVARVRRVVTDAAGTVIYLADITYRADSVRLEIDLVGGSAAGPGDAPGVSRVPDSPAPAPAAPAGGPRRTGKTRDRRPST